MMSLTCKRTVIVQHRRCRPIGLARINRLTRLLGARLLRIHRLEPGPDRWVGGGTPGLPVDQPRWPLPSSTMVPVPPALLPPVLLAFSLKVFRPFVSIVLLDRHTHLQFAVRRYFHQLPGGVGFPLAGGLVKVFEGVVVVLAAFQPCRRSAPGCTFWPGSPVTMNTP